MKEVSSWIGLLRRTVTLIGAATAVLAGLELSVATAEMVKVPEVVGVQLTR